MFDSSSDDDDLALFSSDGPVEKIPVTLVIAEDEVLASVQRLEASGGFQIETLRHETADPATSQGIVIYHIRMLEAFDDLGRIRQWRNERPLQPIIALSQNDDEDFMLEGFKSGATNYLNPEIPYLVLIEILRSYHKMSEAPRLVEIQNAEMLRSMAAEREATEARMAAEGAKAVAQAEAKANERTKEILDNLTEGFFIVEKDLTIANVTSRSCEKIFGHAIVSLPLGDALNLAGGREEFLKGGLEQVFDDFMPLEVNVSLLPGRVETKDGRTLSLAYHPILSETGSPEKVIIESVDITHEVREQARLEQLRQATETLLRILSEREAFEEFLGESKRDLEALRQADQLALGKRILHTLKGNSAVMGLSGLATLIHGFEDELESGEKSVSDFSSIAERIGEGFEEFLDRNKKILQIDWHSNDGHVSLSRSELELVFQYVRKSAGEGKAEVQQVLERSRLRTVHSLLAGFDDIARTLGEKLGKVIEFQLIGGEMRLDPHVYGPFMKSLVHALRNACDHGIEDPEERERLGKPAKGTITFKFEKASEGEMRITLSDTGRGIQLARVLKKALEKEIVKDTEVPSLRVRDVLHLVFHDGLSTAEEISETSGRGVGMACIRQEVEALGGSIRIATKAQKGTVFEFNLPLPEAG